MIQEQPDPRLGALTSLYSAERSAGQDLQKLDFTIFSILLAFLAASIGWTLDKGDSLKVFHYIFMEVPVAALGAYLIQIMAVSKVRSISIDLLEDELVKLAGMECQRKFIGSVAEKRVTDIGTRPEDMANRGLVLLVPIMYVSALIGVFAWIGWCTWKVLVILGCGLLGVVAAVITALVVIYLLVSTAFVLLAFIGKGKLAYVPKVSKPKCETVEGTGGS